MNAERANEIVAHLTGSSQSIEAALRDGEDAYDAVLLEAIGNSIFNCTCCGWWLELEEQADAEDGPMCVECEQDQ